MSNWQETCSQQLVRLEKTAVLADKLMTLCNKTQANILPELIKEIHEERPRLERQLERLRTNRFEVAVIGLEKAGKSALLNAWLGQEILPSEDRRCTYTTTEILSAATEREQHLLIEYYNREEIDSLLQCKEEDLKKLTPNSKEYKELQADIDETKNSKAKLYEYAAKVRNPPTFFSDIAEITDELYHAVAGRPYQDPNFPDKILMDRSHPRAIKRIQLKTTRLSGTSGIVFHDVPGFNSPVTKHREEAEKRMAECDAIIFAKKMDNFNLDLSETDVLSIADADHIRLEQKIFVVTTQSDKAGDREQYDKWLRDNQNEWGKVPKQRIVPICAIAHLAELGTCTEETKRLGLLSAKKIAEFGIDDGIETLKRVVDDYVGSERTIVLQARCNALVGKVKEQAHQAFELLTPIYGGALNNTSIDEEDLYGEDFGKWWGGEWLNIKRDFKNWYQDNIEIRLGADDAAGEHAKLAELRNDYNEEVNKLFTNLPNKQTMELIYKSEGTHLVPIAYQGNQAIRKKLYPEIQQILRQQLPGQLAGSLKEITDEIVSKAKKSLFNIEDVERNLLEPSALMEQHIRYGFETLFLRFGRVAVDTFIAYPLQDRPRLLQEYGPEIRTLEAFYKGSDKDTKGNLTDYLRAGLWMIKEASSVGVVPPGIGVVIKSAEKKWDPFNDKAVVNPSASSEAFKPNNFEDVVKEIEDDLIALKDYLQNSVFHAAGFITYSKQELQRISELFIDLEDKQRRWDAIVRREAKRHNPNIPFKIDNRIQDFRLRREIALELKEASDIFIQIT